MNRIARVRVTDGDAHGVGTRRSSPWCRLAHATDRPWWTASHRGSRAAEPPSGTHERLLGSLVTWLDVRAAGYLDAWVSRTEGDARRFGTTRAQALEPTHPLAGERHFFHRYVRDANCIIYTRCCGNLATHGGQNGDAQSRRSSFRTTRSTECPVDGPLNAPTGHPAPSCPVDRHISAFFVHIPTGASDRQKNCATSNLQQLHSRPLA